MTRLPHTRRFAAVALAGIAALWLSACGDDGGGDVTAAPAGEETSTTLAEATPVIDPGDGGDYAPELDPADFVDVIDNPYLPFAVGSRWVYEGTSDGEEERVVVEVLDERKVIQGISATVVRDTVSIGGEVVEDTLDWFAQDREGNVWYLGEAVEDFEDGELVSTDGSFEVGVDGALPGIVMLADPSVGDAYRQEFYEGEAEDLGEVLAVDATREVPFGTFEDVLVTKDWNPLDPDPIEEKSYAPGVGLVFEEAVRGDPGRIELVEFTAGG